MLPPPPCPVRQFFALLLLHRCCRSGTLILASPTSSGRCRTIVNFSGYLVLLILKSYDVVCLLPVTDTRRGGLQPKNRRQFGGTQNLTGDRLLRSKLFSRSKVRRRWYLDPIDVDRRGQAF